MAGYDISASASNSSSSATGATSFGNVKGGTVIGSGGSMLIVAGLLALAGFGWLLWKLTKD